MYYFKQRFFKFLTIDCRIYQHLLIIKKWFISLKIHLISSFRLLEIAYFIENIKSPVKAKFQHLIYCEKTTKLFFSLLI